MRKLPHRPHPLHPLDKASHVVVVGKRGAGKSTFVKALMAEIRDHGGAVLGFDLHDEFSEDCELLDGMEPGPLRDRCTTEQLILNPVWLTDPDLSLAVVPNKDTRARDLLDIAPLILDAQRMERGKRLLHFFVSEVGAIKVEAEAALVEISTEWRKFGVAPIYDSQRFVHIPMSSREQSSDIVSFLQDSEADVDALRFRFKDRADRIPTLGRGEYEHWRDTALTKADNVRPINRKAV